MTASSSDIINGFRARYYERMMDAFGARRIHLRAFSLLKPQANECILDVGCGTGAFLRLLRGRSGFPLHLTGIDASEDMLEKARGDAGSISFQCGDASILPFGSASFDAVVSILALHHMSEEIRGRAIGEMARVLRPGGRIILLDLFRPKNRLTGFLRFWFNLHSYTRGNWEFLRAELHKIGFFVTDEGTVRGVVGYLHASASKRS